MGREDVKYYSIRGLLSVNELAEILGLSPQTIRNKMSQGLFPIKHKKIGRLVRFDSRELEKYLRGLPNYQ